MKVVEIDPREAYKRKFCDKQGDRLLDFIFDHGLFPRKIYFPAQASVKEGYLLMLFNDVCKVFMLQNEDSLSVEKTVQCLFGGDVILKNQDEILEEKGDLVITECGASAHIQIEKVLSKLYPRKKSHYFGLEGIKIKGQAYYMLLQVGFLRSGRLRINDTLPKFDNVILKDEKLIIYPVFEDILKRILFSAAHFCLN